jgi:hypothetical protein
LLFFTVTNEIARKITKEEYTVVQTQENQVEAHELFEDETFDLQIIKDLEEKEKENQRVAPNKQRRFEISDESSLFFMKRQQELQMAEVLSRRTDQQTLQMLVQATLRREEDSKKREDKLLALLQR